MIFVFWMLSFKPTFSLSTFTFIKRLLSSSSLSAIRVVSSASEVIDISPGNIQSAKIRPGADCGTDHESLLQNSDLNKAGKSTRPFRYDLNQIPCDYTVEMINKFKGLDLKEYLKNCQQRFLKLYRRWWPNPSPRKKNAKRQNGWLRRPYK